MADSVEITILKKCREALLGGMPLIYIRTDSDILIQRLILNETNPLVVLLSDGGASGSEEEQKRKEYRPFFGGSENDREVLREEDRQLKFCLNYKKGPPKRNLSGLYEELSLPGTGKAKAPFLYTVKLPDADDDAQSRRELRELYSALETYVVCHEDRRHPQYQVLQSCAVILYSSKITLPPFLRTYTEFIDVTLPDESEIREILKEESGGDPALLGNSENLSRLCTEFLGFTSEEIAMTMRRVLSTGSLEDVSRTVKMIEERKRQKTQGGILELCNSDGDVGGMKGFRDWLGQQKEALENTNDVKRKRGTLPPKGVLLCGIPGCGKSEAAKFTAQTLEKPLLKMDIGRLMDRFQGVSEQKMREALQMAETMSPCVLWIDELEKGFSGAGANSDSDSFKRMFAYMLGWMQENEKPCFIFATANDIGGLPKEFFRSGRFDALYGVYLPTLEECGSIFEKCLERAEKTVRKANRLSNDTAVRLFEDGCGKVFQPLMEEQLEKGGPLRIYIGSDIQKLVNIALREIPVKNGIIRKDDWKKKLREIMTRSSFSVYGDGEENLESIAVSYCRMLRKGFLPTSDKVLFRKEDYRADLMDPDHPSDILQGISPDFEFAYDKKLYDCLKKKINDVAWRLEKRERELMIMR